MPIIRCPICNQKITPEHYRHSPFSPFCSERCKMIDLGNWLDQRYTVPVEQPDQDDLDPAQGSQSNPPEAPDRNSTGPTD